MSALKETLNRLRRLPTEPESQHSAWDMSAQAHRVARDGLSALFNPDRPLYQDAVHFAKETHLVQLETHYEMVLSPDLITSGGYQEDVRSMTTTFIETLAKKRKSVTRAELENQVMAFVQNWALTHADTDQVLIWTSYPGLKQDGYHGSDCLESGKPNAKETHHSFFYVMWAEKQAATTLSETEQIKLHVTQYRAWPNLKQARELQQQLATLLGHQNPLQFDPTKPDHSLIENLIMSEGATSVNLQLSAIQSLLYQNTDRWGVDPLTLPIFNHDEFWQTQQALFRNFYEPLAEHLLSQVPTLGENHQSHPYWKSPEYRQILQQLDKAFTYFDGAVQKWVVDHNTNPLYEPFGSRAKQFRHLLRHPMIARALWLSRRQELATLDERLAKTQELYRIDVKQTVFKERLSPDERKWYVANVGSVVSLGVSVFSLAQCGLLSPLSLPLSILKQPAGLNGLVQFESSLRVMPLELQRAFLAELKQERYQEVTFANGQTWMVPASYLEAPGCEVDPVTGRIWGPCTDPTTGERIFLDDPRDTMAFQMNKTQFAQYLQKLENSLTNDELAAAEAALAASGLSAPDQTKAQQLFAYLRQKLIKTSVGFQELLNNDFIDVSTIGEKTSRLRELVKALAIATVNPLSILEAFVAELAVEAPTLVENPEELGRSAPLPSRSTHLPLPNRSLPSPKMPMLTPAFRPDMTLALAV